MASSPASQSAGKAKQMSSRLATMKFMQRASASAPTSPSTPSGKNRPDLSTPNSPLDDGPPSKRIKSSRLSEVQDVVAPQLGNGMETKWAFAVRHDAVIPETDFRIEVLNSRHPDVSQDDESSGSRTEQSQGRKVFGMKKKQNPPKQDTADDMESGNSSDSDDSEGSEDSLDRQARKILDTPESRKAGSATVARSNRISGAMNLDRMQCHGCKGFGHMLRNCPNRDTRRQYQPMGVGQKG